MNYKNNNYKKKKKKLILLINKTIQTLRLLC